MAKKHKLHKSQISKAKSQNAFRLLPSALSRAVSGERLAVIALFLLPLVFYGRFLLGSVMMFGTDFIHAGGYAAHQFMADYIREHLTVAFWQPQILSGQPTVAAFFGDLFYPTLFLRLFLPVHVVWAWTFFLQTFLAGLGTYLFLKALKLNTISAFIAGVAYMFSGSLLTLAYAGHDGRLIGSSLMPLALFFLHRGMMRRQLIQFLLCGLILALQLLSGHIQKVYYTGLLLVAYFVWTFIRTIREEKSPLLALRLTGFFIFSILFAGALAAIQYLPIYGNLPYGARGAERGYEFATSWSMPIAETFDLLTPNFSGGLWNYWSKNPFKLHSEYLGILPLLFALIAIIRSWKKPQVKFFFITSLIVLLMAWGGSTPFYRIPYHLLPGLSKFRGPGMIFFIGSFSIAALAGYGISHLLKVKSQMSNVKFRSPQSTPLRELIYGGGVIISILLFALIARNGLINILNPGARLVEFEANYPSLITGLLFAVLVWTLGHTIVTLLSRNLLKPVVFAIVTTVITVFDIGLSLKLWDNIRGYIRSMPPPKEHFAPDEVVRFLKKDTSFYRVLPLNYERSDEGVLWLHNLHSTGGQMPNPLQTYQDFIGAEKTVMFQPNNLLNPNFMNLLNIKYVITYNLPEDVSRFDEQTQQIINQLKLYLSQPQFNRVFSGVRYAIYENQNFLPRAFVARQYEVLRNKEGLLARLMQPDFNTAQTVLLYTDPGIPPSDDTFFGTAEVVSYDANTIKVHARLSAPGVLILSENYHPDWRVTVDGKPAVLLQAFHTLRAVALSPGEHEVVFAYKSKHYHLGLILTLSALLFIMFIGGISWITQKKVGK